MISIFLWVVGGLFMLAGAREKRVLQSFLMIGGGLVFILAGIGFIGEPVRE